VDDALGRGAVDEVLQLAGLRGDLIRVARGDRRLEATEERLDGGAVVQVALALCNRASDALLLLLDVRHAASPPSVGRRRTLATCPDENQ